MFDPHPPGGATGEGEGEGQERAPGRESLLDSGLPLRRGVSGRVTPLGKGGAVEG